MAEKNQYRGIRKEKRQSDTASFLKSFFTTFLIMAGVATILYLPDVKNVFVDIARVLTNRNTARFEFKLPFSPKRQNILVLGADISNDKENPFKGVRSDSISIVSIAPYAKDVNIISIPRDSKVYISNEKKPDKINHAFSRGGIDLSVATIEETFGIRIDHYVVFSTQALVEFIDSIGGLPIYVEKDMHYKDSTAKLYIDIKKGDRILSGKDVEGFVRFRKDALGDIGRISRQQWFLNALAARTKDPSVLPNLPDAIKNASKYIKTDMTVYQIIQNAMLIKTMDASKIHFVALPGAPSSKDEVSYWILDPEKTQKIIDRLVYRDKPQPIDRPLSAGILYVSGKSDVAQKLKDEFEQKGYDTNSHPRETVSKNQILIHNLDLAVDIVEEIKKQHPEIGELPIMYDMIGFNRAGKDFTVILAK